MNCGTSCVILYGLSITPCNICMRTYFMIILTNVVIYQNNDKLWVFYNYFPPKILKFQISFKTWKFCQNSAKFGFLITHLKNIKFSKCIISVKILPNFGYFIFNWKILDFQIISKMRKFCWNTCSNLAN